MKYLRQRMINATAVLQGDVQNSSTFRSINLTVEVLTLFIPCFLIELNCPVMTPTHASLIYTIKGKAVPLQAWSGPEGSRKLRFPDFMTKAQDGGKVVSLKYRPLLLLGNAPGSHFC